MPIQQCPAREPQPCARHANLLPFEMKRLHLEEENGKLKKILADLLRYKKMLQDSR